MRLYSVENDVCPIADNSTDLPSLLFCNKESIYPTHVLTGSLHLNPSQLSSAAQLQRVSRMSKGVSDFHVCGSRAADDAQCVSMPTGMKSVANQQKWAGCFKISWYVGIAQVPVRSSAYRLLRNAARSTYNPRKGGQRETRRERAGRRFYICALCAMTASMASG